MNTHRGAFRYTKTRICLFVVALIGLAVSAEETTEEHEEAIQVSDEILEEFGVKFAPASGGIIRTEQTLNGEIAVVPRNVIHVAPPIEGIVTNVYRSLGDSVEEGEILATLTSRELATARAELLAAISKQKLARTTYTREKNLYEKKISAESDFLSAEQAYASASIDVESAKHRLLALGIGEDEFARKDSHGSLNSYSLTAASAGVIVEKHITRGELVGPTSRSFVITDLSTVWVALTVYQKDLDAIREALTVRIKGSDGENSVEGTIEYVSPIIDPSTRSTTARLIIDNESGRWRPGMFIEAVVSVSEVPAEIVVPNSAVQVISGKSVVFIRDHDEITQREVALGQRDGSNVSILSGLHTGEVVATTNAFTLKAEIQKSEFGDDHGH